MRKERLNYLKEKLREWDGNNSTRSFYSQQLWSWLKRNKCPLWLKAASMKRLVAYLIVLKREGILLYNEGKWTVSEDKLIKREIKF